MITIERCIQQRLVVKEKQKVKFTVIKLSRKNRVCGSVRVRSYTFSGKITKNGLKSHLHLSRTNALSFKVW